jgi:hypothetical protein
VFNLAYRASGDMQVELANQLMVGDPEAGATIAEAVSSIGSDYRRLIVPPGTYALPAKIPSNIDLEVMPGAILTTIKNATDIEGLSEANPCVVTYTSHGLATGDKIKISGITQANWKGLNDRIFGITRINDNSFSIFIATTSFGAYVPATDPGVIEKPVCEFAGRVEAGRHRIFSSNGFLAFRNNLSVYPEWWGAFPNGSDCSVGLQAAIDCACSGTSNISAGRDSGVVVELASGGYLVDYRVNLRPRVLVKGTGVNTWMIASSSMASSKIDGYAVFGLAEGSYQDALRPFTQEILKDVTIYLYDAPHANCGIWIGKSGYKLAWRNISFRDFNTTKHHQGFVISEEQYYSDATAQTHANHDDSFYSNIFFHGLLHSEGAFYVERTIDFQQCWMEHFSFYACTTNVNFGGINSYFVHCNFNPPYQSQLLANGSGGSNPRVILTNGGAGPNSFVACYWDGSIDHINILTKTMTHHAGQSECFKMIGHNPGFISYSNVWDEVSLKDVLVTYTGTTTVRYTGDLEHFIVPGVTIHSYGSGVAGAYYKISEHVVSASVYDGSTYTTITISGSTFPAETVMIRREYNITYSNATTFTVDGNLVNHAYHTVLTTAGTIFVEWCPAVPYGRGVIKQLLISGTPTYNSGTKKTTVVIATASLDANIAKVRRQAICRTGSIHGGTSFYGPEGSTAKYDRFTVGLSGYLGGAGTELRQIRKGSNVVADLPSISAGATYSVDIADSSVLAASAAYASTNVKLTDGLIISHCYCTTGHVYVILLNTTAGAIDMGAVTFYYTVVY